MKDFKTYIEEIAAAENEDDLQEAYAEAEEAYRDGLITYDAYQLLEQVITRIVEESM